MDEVSEQQYVSGKVLIQRQNKYQELRNKEVCDERLKLKQALFIPPLSGIFLSILMNYRLSLSSVILYSFLRLLKYKY